MKIGRTYRFEAAHYLPLVPEGHKCRRMHGHNYRIEVVASGPVGVSGFVEDFFDLDARADPLIQQLDHRLLNEVIGLENPTAEIIATWFMAHLDCESIRVYENDDSWAEISK